MYSKLAGTRSPATNTLGDRSIICNRLPAVTKATLSLTEKAKSVAASTLKDPCEMGFVGSAGSII